MLGWAASQGATLPKPPMGTVSTAHPRHSEGRDVGATHHGHWLPLTHTSVYSMGGGPTSACLLGPGPQLSLPPPQRVPKAAAMSWERW